MKKFTLKITLSIVFILLNQSFLFSQDKVYLRSTVGPPWGSTSNETAMDTVFGAGNWQNLQYETVNTGALLSPSTCFIFMEGGADNDAPLETFLIANMTAIENWVSAGGNLFINSAGWSVLTINFGFGGVLLTYQPTTAQGVIASGASGHPIFNGPYTPVGTNWTGSSFAHSWLSGPGITPLIVDIADASKILAAEKSWGAGKVIFGGMTTTNFHNTQPEATNLRQNILSYLEICNSSDIDAGVSQIISPFSGCGLAVYEDVTVVINNFGLDTIFTLDASYTVNGGVPVTESVSTTILPGNNFTYTFASQANLGTFGTYNFDAWTTLAGDTNNFNDSTINYQVIRDSVFIFVENICIHDAPGGAGSCNFSNDLCNDGNDFGDITLKTSPLFFINTPTVDSITFYLYYTDCSFSTNDFTFYLNSTQIGTFTNTILECVCAPSLGTYPYIFSITDTAVLNAAWSDTNTLSVQHNNVNMAVAGYTATVYSQIQCSLLTAIEVTTDTSICIGDSVLLSVSIIDSNTFVPPYSYSWIPSTGLSCDTCQSPLASPSSTITYMVMVTDSTGTQDSAFVTVTVFSSAPVADAGTDTTICEGDLIQLNALGGATYLWDPGTGLSDSIIANPLANPSTTTTWSLTAINACGSDIDSITVFVNPLPIITVSSDTTICPVDSVQLIASGGVSYSWSPTSGLDNPNIANPIASPSVTTTYIVAVTSGSGCVNFDSVIVVVDSVAQIVAMADKDTICLGDTTQLFANSCTPMNDDFDPDIDFALWTGIIGGAATIDCGSVSGFALYFNGSTTREAITQNLNVLAGGNINFYLKIGSGAPPCETADAGEDIVLEYSTDNGITWNNINTYFTGGYVTFTAINENMPAGAQTASTQFRFKQITFSGSCCDHWAIDDVNIACSGVDTTLSFTWNPSTGLSNPNISNPLASPSSTTTYVVEAAIGTCSSFDTITIYVDTVNFIVASPDTAICFGDSVQLTATGSGAYLWSPSTGLSCTGCQSPYASPTATTTYYVTTPAGCAPTDSVTVTVNGAPIFTVTARDSICAGDTTQLAAYTCASFGDFYDGFEDGTYNNWSTGVNYTYTVTNTTSANGVYSLEQTGSGGFYDGLNYSFAADTSDYISVYMRTQQDSTWNNYFSVGDSNITSNFGIIFLYANQGNYTLYANFTNQELVPYNIGQWYHFEFKNIDYVNKSLDFYADGILIASNFPFRSQTSNNISQIHLYNVNNFTSYYDDIQIGTACVGIDTTLSYTWSPAGSLSNPNIYNPVASPTTTTSYIVVASGGGCSSTDTITIYTTTLDVAANANTPLICSGDTAQLDVTANIGGASFSWSPAAGLSCTNCPAPLASPPSTTMYYVTATSGSCTDVDSILITVGTGPIAPSCTPVTTGYCCGMGIYNVTFNTINNTTADGIEGYQDYSCTNATNVIIDQTYTISIQTGTGLQENVRVWIDYNNNGVFANDSTTELVFWSNNILTNHSGTVTIPFSAVINTPLRMRVGSDYYLNSPPAPCNNVQYGQFEDYTVIVLPNTIPPVADFNITVLDTCQGIVSFTDQSLYNPTSWFWDFGDNSGLSTSQNPFYTYSLPGTYTVTLIVTNPWGSNTITQQVVITSLVADFTVSSNTVGIGENVNFFDNSIGANSWSWDFGDGFSSTNQNTFHAYMSANTYTVVLTVTNASGCIAQIMMQIMVCTSIPQTGAIIGPVNMSVSDTANYSVPFNNGSIYNWTVIGGNQISGGQTNFISVQWTTAGIGQVIVAETDSIGCTGDPVILIVNIGSTAINEFKDSGFRFNIYPNPSRGVFVLTIDDLSLSAGGVELTIYDMLGSIISKTKIVNRTSEIDISDYQSGIYHLQIITDKVIVNKKVVIE